jgi:hypothetical protein
MPSSIANLLERNLLDVFGERDAARRRGALESIWSPDGVFVDPDGRSVGFDAIDGRIADLQTQFPGFVFAANGPAEVMQDVGRMAWGFGPVGVAPVVTGTDFAITDGGKIVSLYAFIDS